MREIHPFGSFTPPNTRYLFLGSFTGKQEGGYNWFFSNKRSQFWPILENVYGQSLKTKHEKQELFKILGMAITDIILECERNDNSNLDMNLKNMVLNTKAITEILEKNNIKKIYFSSRFAEKLFKRQFKDLILKYMGVELITLPSPSPRYAAMSKLEKIKEYKKLLPVL